MTAVIYARYSSDSQREESIEGRIRECTAFAEKNGITILRHYIDRAFSAKTDNRPAFQEMIKDSSKKLFDTVIVWKLDRFARNRYDSARYKALLKKHGVKVVSATEAISEGSEGIILEAVLEGFAEYYSADLSEKVSRGMTENALKCKYNGGILPIGFFIDQEGRYQIDPLTAPFVLEAYKQYADGATMKEILKYLNEHNIKNAYGHEISYNNVQSLLKNRKYIGEYRFRDTVTPNGIPAIVPEELFERVQEKIEKNRRAPARHKAEDDYLLTTKLFCGYCGAYLCSESETSRTNVVHHYYKCVTAKRKRGNCHLKPIKKFLLENAVIDSTMDMLQDEKVIETIIATVMDMQDRENVDLPLYEKQLRETQTGLDNLLYAIQQGMLTPSTKQRLLELEAAKEELEVKIANEKLTKPRVPEEYVRTWLLRFRELDVSKKEQRRILIDSFVNSIIVYNDHIEITYNNKEGCKIISFEEVQEAASSAMKKAVGSDMEWQGPPSKCTAERRCFCLAGNAKVDSKPSGSE